MNGPAHPYVGKFSKSTPFTSEAYAVLELFMMSRPGPTAARMLRMRRDMPACSAAFTSREGFAFPSPSLAFKWAEWS